MEGKDSFLRIKVFWRESCYSTLILEGIILETMHQFLFGILFTMVFGSYIYTSMAKSAIYSKMDGDTKDTSKFVTEKMDKILEKIDVLTKMIYERRFEERNHKDIR